MDVTMRATTLEALEASVRELERAGLRLMQGDYSSAESWGSVRYVRVLLADVDGVFAELSRTCLALAGVDEASEVGAARGGLFRARCQYEQARVQLETSKGVGRLGRRGRSPGAAVAFMSRSLAGVRHALAEHGRAAPPAALAVGEAGRVLRAMEVIGIKLAAVVTAALTAEVPGRLDDDGLAGVLARIRYAGVALREANAALAMTAIGGAKMREQLCGIPDLATLRAQLGELVETVPAGRCEGDEVSVWLSGDAGEARLRELAGVLWSLEATVASASAYAETRWRRLPDRKADVAARWLVCCATELMQAADRPRRGHATGSPSARLVRWQPALKALMSIGEGGAGAAAARAAAELPAADVAGLFRDAAAAVRAIGPIVLEVGWVFTDREVGRSRGCLLRRARELREAPALLSDYARQVAKARDR